MVSPLSSRPPVVIELLWFAAGATLASALALVLMPRQRHRALPDPAQVPPAPRRPAVVPEPRLPIALIAPPVPPPPTSPAGADTRRIALSLADELASLTSGILGSAHNLVVAAPDFARLPQAAETLLDAVHRLRTLHAKLIAFGKGGNPAAGSTTIDAVVHALASELPQLQLGLQMRWEPQPELPRVHASFEVVRDALLFLCSALLRAERGASILGIEAEYAFGHDEPGVRLLVSLEHGTDVQDSDAERATDRAWHLDYEAAANLIRTQGGNLAISHLPGRAVHAVVQLPVAQAEPEPLAAEPPVLIPTPAQPSAGPRDYGGALVLEADAAIRAMLANELKANGRAVFACADGAAAQSFLQATPDRFELLIVDHYQHLTEAAALTTTIRTLAPHLRVCVLAPLHAGVTAFAEAVHLPKPFGVHELRQALASVLAMR